MFALLLAAILMLPAVLAAQNTFYLHDHDTVMFYGDSITEQKFYTNFVDAFVAMRYPGLDVRFVNSAWGGENAIGGNGGTADERLRRDVIPYKPTVMTVMLGMNDGGYRAFDQERFERYSNGMEHIVQVVKEAFPSLRITLIEPSPYDDVTQPPQFADGYNAVLVRYGAFVKQMGERGQMPVVDMNGPVVDVLRKAYAANPEVARTLIPGRIHPSPAIHLVMAEALLKGWGAGPTVSTVAIDAGSKQIKEAVNTEISGLTVNRSISWTQKDAALPFPVNVHARSLPIALRRGGAGTNLVLKVSDFIDALDQQTLRVSGLPAAEYSLKINGQSIGSYSREQLEKGINLAALTTPMSEQAAGVLNLVFQKTDIHTLRWRNIQMPFQNADIPRLSAIESDLDSLEAEIAARERAAAVPQACYYELIPE
ncbi:MAG TPA: SGNH/GDSL hydrolase family protein [Bryobacteraceae bacterium]|nr:SGNH/GDSL hydrolase family protein [Bryobacteraceae bacterium]